MKIQNILNDGIGEIELVDQMGSDLKVVNAARISFGAESKTLTDKDKKLIKYLADNEHTSPFRHSFVSIRIKAPEFIMRQWYKHVIGCSWGTTEFHNHAWNEISGRYVEVEPQFHIPDVLRKQSTSNKQGSDGVVDQTTQIMCIKGYKESLNEAYNIYKLMLQRGVAKEQARTILPLSVYTEVLWTASLQAVHNFVELRKHPHAQKEIQMYANAVSELCSSAFPESWKTLTSK